MSSERNYGIDLLRLVLMYMVCILHTLGQGGILGASIAGTLGFKTFWLLETFAYCAVDGFAIISGYVAKDRPSKYNKIVEMWFQVVFYSLILTVLLKLVGYSHTLPAKEIIKCALPVTFMKYWYFSAYFVLFFAMPLINKFLFTLDELAAKKAIILIFVIFTIVGLYKDPFSLAQGCSPIWLIVLYCLGVLANRADLFKTKNSIVLILIWAVCILLSWAVHMFLGRTELTGYTSPTILLSALIMVVLFSRLKLKGTVIGKLSPLAFGIYLFQLNQVVWNKAIANAFVSAVEKPVYVGLLMALGFALVIFIAGMVVEFIRTQIARLIRIPALSMKIAGVLDKLISKLCVLL